MMDNHERRFSELWEELNKEWTEAKNPMGATVELISYYRTLTPGARTLADAEIVDWLLSENGDRRFDAMALVREFRITGAVQNLITLAQDLRGRAGPEARYELEKAEQILRWLDEP